MSFGENLQVIRKKNQLSQENLAEILGVSRQAVSKWELGEGYPEVDKLLLLSKKLNISLDSLFGNEHTTDTSENGKLSDKIRIASHNEGVMFNVSKVTFTVLSPDKKTLLSCFGGLKVDGCTLQVQTENDDWVMLYAYNNPEEALSDLQKIKDAMQKGEMHLEL